MGLELIKVINRFMKIDNISKIPKDKDGFFKYLNASINREKAGFYREYDENDTIKIPKEKKRKLREVEDFIRMKESHLGRKLTSDEQIQGITKWFEEQEYVALLNSKNVGSISYTSNDGESEIDVLNYADTLSDDPRAEYMTKTDMETVLETVKTLLDKEKERSRDCYRALFTLYCIDNYKDFEGLYPVLDKNILETWQKGGKSPNQYEIYQKYNPNAQKKSASATASTNLRKFLNAVEICLKEKNK
jgi:hypothetical protein